LKCTHRCQADLDQNGYVQLHVADVAAVDVATAHVVVAFAFADVADVAVVAAVAESVVVVEQQVVEETYMACEE
jgi:hypothetical protein